MINNSITTFDHCTFKSSTKLREINIIDNELESLRSNVFGDLNIMSYI